MYRKGGEFKLPFSTFKSDGSLDYNNTPTFYTSKILQDLKNSILQKAGIEKITQREDEILDIIDKSQEYIENTSDVSWQHAPDYFDLNFNKVNPAGSDPYLLIKARNKLLSDAFKLDKNIPIRYGYSDEMAEDFISKFQSEGGITKGVQDLKKQPSCLAFF